MILEALKRNHVEDDKLWEMVSRANQLTCGDYKSYDDNAAALVPLMDRILLRSREKGDSRVYFYAMAKFFWLLERVAINDIRRRFQISEMFHRDIRQWDVKNVGRFEGEWRVSIAARILNFYLDYPQVNEDKLEQMLEIFLDLEQRYGSDWNCGDYYVVMVLAASKQDKKLAETARKKLSKGDFKLWCYTCYYVLFEDFEGIEELISSVVRRSIPAKYQWCFEKCESSSEKGLITTTLKYCLNYGTTKLFAKVFARWKSLYQEPQKEDLSTHEILFHVLAGELSCSKERLHTAEKDDQDKREHRESPTDSMYWALCWYVYFLILEKCGVKTVKLNLGDGSGEDRAGEENPSEWTCRDAAIYFEHQADEIGEQMEQGRRWFSYGAIKQRYRECFLEKG